MSGDGITRGSFATDGGDHRRDAWAGWPYFQSRPRAAAECAVGKCPGCDRHDSGGSMSTINLELVRKYNQPGPRYTSYPPATRFAPSFARELFLERIEENNKTNTGNLSLYFHLPFCRSLCWYCGCNTVITTQQKKSAAYLQLIDQEMQIMRGRLNPERKVVQLHFGGGTPTFLLPDELRELG